jgi:signal transduction histidine kinase
MPQTRLSHRRSFIWQAALIMAPLVVLAVFGFYSLRRDRLLVQQEAQAQAKSLADELLPRFVNVLTNGPFEDGKVIRINSAGKIIRPPVSQPMQPNALDPGLLNASQRQLWDQARRAEIVGDTASAAKTFEEFKKSSPPPDFLALANYGIALRISQSDPKGAAIIFKSIRSNNPNAVTESGIPLAPLCELRLAEIGLSQPVAPGFNPDAALSDFCSNIVTKPNPISQGFLDSLRYLSLNQTSAILVRKWDRIFHREERLRFLLESQPQVFRESSPAPLVWMRGEADDDILPGEASEWLIAHFQIPAQRHELGALGLDSNETKSPDQVYLCQTEAEIGKKLSDLVKASRYVPDYFGIGVEIAGRKVTKAAPDLRVWHEVIHSGKGSAVVREYRDDPSGPAGTGGDREFRGLLAKLEHAAPSLLASATDRPTGQEGIKLSVYLTSSEALLKTQNSRRFWFGALIVCAALMALIGLFNAWHIFRRQEKLAEQKTNFVSSVSHELRAPIASMRLMAESLETGKVNSPDKQQEYFRFIGQESRRLTSLVENILDFSRIEQGRKQYQFEPVNVNELVRRTVKLMSPTAAEKEVALELQPMTGPQIEASLDGQAMQQALINLIDNAVKHSAAGKVVRVGLEEAPLSGNGSEIGTKRFLLWVEDTGPGIPVQEQEKIFERFYRLGSELRRETQGVGIGLTIVKHIVEAHGGIVRVQSAPGKGSRFTMDMPMATMPAVSLTNIPLL